MQTVGKTPVIPIPRAQGHSADPFQAYLDILAASSSTHHNKPLLTITSGSNRTVVTIPMLVRAFTILLKALQMDTGLYSLYSLQRDRERMGVYQGGMDQIDIKRHRLWASDAF